MDRNGIIEEIAEIGRIASSRQMLLNSVFYVVGWMMILIALNWFAPNQERSFVVAAMLVLFAHLLLPSILLARLGVAPNETSLAKAIVLRPSWTIFLVYELLSYFLIALILWCLGVKNAALTLVIAGLLSGPLLLSDVVRRLAFPKS